MRKAIKKAAALLLALVLSMGSAACAKEQAPALSEEAAEVLVYGSGDYTAINPALYEHGEINLLLFAGLMAHNGQNEVVPDVAETWEYDAKNCTYTFKLRRDVYFHDGHPLTSRDVRFTLQAIMDPENASENASNSKNRSYSDSFPLYLTKEITSFPWISQCGASKMTTLQKYLP